MRRDPTRSESSTTSTDASESYFVRIGDDRFRPKFHVGGAWVAEERHLGPVIGLSVHCVERAAAHRNPDDSRAVARVGVDILGLLAMEDFDVRPLLGPEPGRTTAWLPTAVELVAGELVDDVARFLALVDVANGIAGRQPPAE